jgi:hypothetical protein
MNKNELFKFLDEKLPNESIIEVTGKLEHPIQNNSLYGEHSTPILQSNTMKGSFKIQYKFEQK